MMWDVFAVSTYFTVSTIFFYVGLLPDIAAVQDRTRGVISKCYAALSLGWREPTRPGVITWPPTGSLQHSPHHWFSRSLGCVLGLRDVPNHGLAQYVFPPISSPVPSLVDARW